MKGAAPIPKIAQVEPLLRPSGQEEHLRPHPRCRRNVDERSMQRADVAFLFRARSASRDPPPAAVDYDPRQEPDVVGLPVVEELGEDGGLVFGHDPGVVEVEDVFGALEPCFVQG